MLVFAAVWLLVIGYGLIFVGYSNLNGKITSFQQAFIPSGLFGSPAEESAANAAAAAASNPIQAKGGSQTQPAFRGLQ